MLETQKHLRELEILRMNEFQNKSSLDNLLASINYDKITANTKQWIESEKFNIKDVSVTIKFKEGSELAEIEKELSIIGVKAEMLIGSGILKWSAKINDEQYFIDLINSDLVESVHISTTIPNETVTESGIIGVTPPLQSKVGESADSPKTYWIIAGILLLVGGILYFNNK